MNRRPEMALCLLFAALLVLALIPVVEATQSGTPRAVSDDELRRRAVEAINETSELRERLAALEARVDELDATCERVQPPGTQTPDEPPRRGPVGRSM